MMNPLNDINNTITSKFFDEKIKAITAKYF